MYPVIIEYRSKAYDEMVALRSRVLREPLGLIFSDEDLLSESDDILLGLSTDSSDRIVACCVLTPLDDRVVKLRQMAVDSAAQNSGLGTSMLGFAEYVSAKQGFDTIMLHARKVAVGFYEKYDYKIVGQEFVEVGIPHYEMIKQINNR